MLNTRPNMQEGLASFWVGNAFYRPASKITRDLGVLAAAVYQSHHSSLRVLDAMAGCGVRSLRYYLESHADEIWVNEGNSEIGEVLQANLQPIIPAKQLQITHLDANRVFFDCYNRADYYDFVDVDCFGSAAPYLSTALWATKLGGLLYLTSTDGRTATGHLPENSLKVYGAFARSHPASQEQALRLLIGSLQQQAATKGLGIQPIFSLFTGQTYRVLVRLVKGSRLSEKNYGFLGYCHRCGDYTPVSWRKLGRSSCPFEENVLTLSGPMWLGELHNSIWLQEMQSLATKWQWGLSQQLLEQMLQEATMPPYFYLLGEIGKRGKMDIPKRDRLLEALREKGFLATPTHINAEAIKTNADLKTCVAIAKSIQHDSNAE